MEETFTITINYEELTEDNFENYQAIADLVASKSPISSLKNNEA
jgi:acyl carrier protein